MSHATRAFPNGHRVRVPLPAPLVGRQVRRSLRGWRLRVWSRLRVYRRPGLSELCIDCGATHHLRLRPGRGIDDDGLHAVARREGQAPISSVKALTESNAAKTRDCSHQVNARDEPMQLPLRLYLDGFHVCGHLPPRPQTLPQQVVPPPIVRHLLRFGKGESVFN